MKKQNNKSVTFKEYQMQQAYLLPPSLEELIPERHLVRIVNQAIEKMEISSLIAQYKGGGRSSYHPKMLLKILIYGYTQKLYSSRQIAKALRENIHFMWLSGQNRPDFRTVNRFRSSRLKEGIESVFQSVVQFLIEEGYVKLEHYFLDGTIIEANANRYTYVWKKSTEKYKAKVQEKIKALWEQIEAVNEAENRVYGDKDLDEVEGNEICSEKMDVLVKKLNEQLKKKPDKTVKKLVGKLEKEALPRLKYYEQQEQELNGKNSYSKTDKDASFMRMKDDPLGTAQVRPAYNVQTGTENQFIVGYSIHQKAGDTSHFIDHLTKLENQLGCLPQNIVADSGYGSEENYRFIAKKGLGNFVKYSFFHREQQRLKKDMFRVERFEYLPQLNQFLCPAKHPLTYQHTEPSRSINGFLSSRKIYHCHSCSSCDFKSDCLHSEKNRSIQVNFELNKLKNEAKSNLLSELGKTLRKRRSIEVESVFGQIKHNFNFRKFTLRGLQNVALEWGLIALAHNFKKIPA